MNGQKRLMLLLSTQLCAYLTKNLCYTLLFSTLCSDSTLLNLLRGFGKLFYTTQLYLSDNLLTLLYTRVNMSRHALTLNCKFLTCAQPCDQKNYQTSGNGDDWLFLFCSTPLDMMSVLGISMIFS